MRTATRNEKLLLDTMPKLFQILTESLRAISRLNNLESEGVSAEERRAEVNASIDRAVAFLTDAVMTMNNEIRNE